MEITHGCFAGSEELFNKFRLRLALAAGITDCRSIALTMRFQLVFTEAHRHGIWDQIPVKEPLLILLVHHEREGVIQPEEGTVLADRMVDLLDNIGELFQEEAGEIKQQVIFFVRGLRVAAAAEEEVLFK